MNKLPLYDISLEDIAQGMYKISLVDKPAIEEDFIHFNEVEKVQMFADEKKKEVVGPIMIPNKEILRFSPEMGYYYVRFTEETISEIMYKYSKEGLFNAFGINHSYDTDEVVMLEVWTKESDNDKSVDYGYDLPNGTVFVKAKIESDELFTAIENGEINGFSIEIKADIKPTINNEEQMNEFQFGKELGALEAKFETALVRLEALEKENQELKQSQLEFAKNWEEKVKYMEERHTVSETNDSTGETTITTETKTTVEETFAEETKAAEEAAEEFKAEEENKEVEEEFSAEEKADEAKAEEQFAAEQKAEEEKETPEDKTVVFNGITPEKVNLINNFFNRK
jgi:hypothetical protein